MKKRLIVGMVLALALMAAALPVAAQDPEQNCFNKGGTWYADEQRCEVFFAVEVRIASPQAPQHRFDLSLVAYP